MADLRATDPRDDKTRIEQTKGGLLKDSYRWILGNADFQRWRDDEESRLLWIKGAPGKGKTMLLCGIVDELKSTISNGDNGLLSFFFCQGTDSRINNATAVLRGLIYLLVDQRPSLIPHVRKKYDHAGKKLFEDVNAWAALSEIFKNILHDPSLKTTYLIIDALDECETDLPKLLDFIAQNSTALSRVKWVVSSRNRIDIEQKLRLDESRARLSLELKEIAEQVSYAVMAYINHCVSELVEIQRDKALQDQLRDKMQRKANGTFLWVSLVIKELKEVRSWEVLNVVDEVPTDLEDMYCRMMGQIQMLKRGNPDICRRVLSTVAAAYRPLHLQELYVLSDLPAEVMSENQSVARIVSMCGSFLAIQDDNVYIIHQLARDFLSNSHSIFPYGVGDVHYTIFLRSLQIMSTRLQRDIYRLCAPGFPIDQVNQPEPDPLAAARYSCVHWVDHLCDSSRTAGHDDHLRDGGTVDNFMRKKFLYWLEALSLLRSISHGVLSMTKLTKMIKTEKTSHLYKIFCDGRRFILYNRSIIEEAPLQLYYSALIFAPEVSVIRQNFVDQVPSWIKRLGSFQWDWSSLLQTLEGHTGCVNAVAFSPDDKMVASASSDKTVRLWDAATGAALQTLEGHANTVNAVAFSPDGKMVASSDDNTVRLWDVVTGAALRTRKGHRGGFNAVAFSPDGKMVASASCWPFLFTSHEYTIWLWDAATGAVLQTFENCRTLKLVFSTDGSYLETDEGSLHIQSNCAGIFASKSQAHRSVRLRGNWITQDGKNILWIPPDYRPTCSAFQGDRFVFGYQSDRVAFIKFDSC